MITSITLNTALDKLYRVDTLLPYAVMRVEDVSVTAGGKGLNVARVAAIAGENATAMGFVGGHNGALFQSLITVPRLTAAFTEVQAETRSCVNIMETKTGKSTEFLEPGNPVTQADLQRFLADYAAHLRETDLVTINGSLPKGTPPDFYKTLISMAKQAGKPVFVDTSGAALQAAIAAKPTFIKPNTDEIQTLLNHAITSRAELLSAAKQLHADGISIVAISQGARGVLVVCDAGVFEGKPPEIDIINTVGCGDSMVAGFAVGRVRGWPMEESIRYAVAVSAANALTKATGSFLQTDLDVLLPHVQIEKIE